MQQLRIWSIKLDDRVDVIGHCPQLAVHDSFSWLGTSETYFHQQNICVLQLSCHGPNEQSSPDVFHLYINILLHLLLSIHIHKAILFWIHKAYFIQALLVNSTTYK